LKMTGRGNSAQKPHSPLDPSLESRPVPQKHRFSTRSFGTGAVPNIQQTVTSFNELSRADQGVAEPRSLEKIQAGHDCRFLEHIEIESNIDYWGDDRPGASDPTWGFFLVLTDYASTTTANIPRAVEKLLEVQ
jgi:hypothetical protein